MHTVEVKIENLHRNFSFIQLNSTNQVVANNIGSGDDVHVRWLDQQAGRANLWVATRKKFITINSANQVVGSPNSQVLQLDEQDNGSYVIHMAGDNINRLVLNDLAGPVTNEKSPHPGAEDYNKQFWMLIPPTR